MVASPVFKTMFTSSFKEAETARVTLTGKTLVEVRWMLDYLYPDVAFKLTCKFKLEVTLNLSVKYILFGVMIYDKH